MKRVPACDEAESDAREGLAFSRAALFSRVRRRYLLARMPLSFTARTAFSMAASPWTIASRT